MSPSILCSWRQTRGHTIQHRGDFAHIFMLPRYSSEPSPFHSLAWSRSPWSIRTSLVSDRQGGGGGGICTYSSSWYGSSGLSSELSIYGYQISSSSCKSTAFKYRNSPWTSFVEYKSPSTMCTAWLKQVGVASTVLAGFYSAGLAAGWDPIFGTRLVPVSHSWPINSRLTYLTIRRSVGVGSTVSCWHVALPML